MLITREYLEKLGCSNVNGEYLLRLGAINMALRLYGDKCYCELPGLYVGEITIDRLHTLYHGLTGKTLNSLLSPMDQAISEISRNVGNYSENKSK